MYTMTWSCRRRRTHTARWAPPTIAPDRVVVGQRLESSMLLPLPLAVTAARTDLTVARLDTATCVA